MYGGVGTFHADVLSAKPETLEQKLQLVEEIKNRCKGSISNRNFPEAVELYGKAIEVCPDENANSKSILHANRSMCHANMSNFDKAFDDAEKSISLDPTYTKAYYRKGAALIGLERFKDAVAALEVGLLQKPGDKDLTNLKLKAESGSAKPKAATQSKSSISTPAVKPAALSSSAPPQQTTKAKAAAAPSAGAADDNENAEEKIRGYKKTSDGRTTSYFNNELDEKTKALIGDIAPKRMEPAQPQQAEGNTLGSSWNAAGTFESRSLTTWAQPRLKELLAETKCTVPVAGASPGCFNVKSVSDVSGDAEVVVARGKRKHVCDLSANIEWALCKGVDGSGDLCADGKATIVDITADCDFEIEVKVNTCSNGVQKSDGWLREAQKSLESQINEALKTFVCELKAKV